MNLPLNGIMRNAIKESTEMQRLAVLCDYRFRTVSGLSRIIIFPDGIISTISPLKLLPARWRNTQKNRTADAFTGLVRSLTFRLPPIRRVINFKLIIPCDVAMLF